MRDWLNEINGLYPVRNHKEQKNAFLTYGLSQAKSLGYDTLSEENEGHVNLVIGNPDQAKILFTAHYDTPRRSVFPNLMLPANKALHWAYAFGIVLPLLAVSILGARFAQSFFPDTVSSAQGRLVYVFTYLFLYFVLFLLLFRGPANRHNKNDNTSGTAAVLTLAELLAGDERAAFILFDDEEKGKKGSKAFAKAHPKLKTDSLVVNMDCVGNGDQFLAAVPDTVLQDLMWESLEKALTGISCLILSTRSTSLNSDQKSFDRGIGICACIRGKLLHTPRIHTRRDTVASSANINQLAQALAQAVRDIR